MQKLDPRAVWFFFLQNLMANIGTIFALMVMFVSSVALVDDGDMTLFWFRPDVIGSLLVLLVVLIVVLAFVWAKLTYHFYRYELREDGFRKEHGVIWKKYVTIPYDRIQNVDIHRGVIARLLGISDIQVQTAGGITVSSYGAFSEGRLPGIDKNTAEQMRDALVAKTRGARSQGL